MKKRKWLRIISFIVLLAVLSGNSKMQVQGCSCKYVYSNLADRATQKKVKKQLKKAGISSKNATAFMSEVKLYNKAIKKVSLVKKGYAHKNKLPTYKEDKISSLWQKNYPVFAGYDCRITAYTLMRNNITVKHPVSEAKENLAIDRSALEDDPLKLYSKTDIENFQTIYNAVPAKESKSVKVHCKTLQKAWKKAGITFDSSADAKLVSVVMHDGYEKELYIGHAGVLLQQKKGFLFVEKLSFEMPYQVHKFRNKKALKKYLMKMYGDYTDEQSAKPFIMLNDKKL